MIIGSTQPHKLSLAAPKSVLLSVDAEYEIDGPGLALDMSYLIQTHNIEDGNAPNL